jgi:hypothetical protein
MALCMAFTCLGARHVFPRVLWLLMHVENTAEQ